MEVGSESGRVVHQMAAGAADTPQLQVFPAPRILVAVAVAATWLLPLLVPAVLASLRFIGGSNQNVSISRCDY